MQTGFKRGLLIVAFSLFLQTLLLLNPAHADQVNGGLDNQSNPSLLAMNDEDQSLEDFYGNEEFVTIATGAKKPIYKAPAVASVITAEQIKAMGARTLDEALETVPGLHVAPSALSRLNSVYSIRGIHTGDNPQVLMLMNGIPFPMLNTGGRPQNFLLPVSAISRIEVIRGPGSAVYGADAFAGVINIITKDAEEVQGTEAGAEYGSFESKDIWFQHGNRYGAVDIMFSFEWQKSEGDRNRVADTDLQTIFDNIFGTKASNAPGPLETRYDVINAHLELKWKDWTLRNWYWRQYDAGVGAGAAQSLDPEGYDKIESDLVDLSWKNNDIAKEWDLSANFNYRYYDGKTHFVLLPRGATVLIGSDGNIASFPPFTSTNFPDGVIGNPDALDQQVGMDLTAIFTGFADHRLRYAGGIKYQDENTSETKNFGPGVTIDTLTDVSDTQYVFMPDTHRTVWYLSFQDEWQFAPDWELTGGVRYDDYSDFGSTINPRIALVWATRYNLTSKLLYGRAFRAPSFSEQFQQNNPVVMGNTNLDPETIATYELAFDYRPTLDIQTNLNIFGYRAYGLIEFVTDKNGVTKTAQNARDQLGFGFELEASWNFNKQLKLMVSYARQHSEDVKTGKKIADAPGQQLMLAADWKFIPDWLLHPQVNWVASRQRAANDLQDKIDDYILVDLTLRRTNLFSHYELALAVRNLFDEDAYEPSNGIIANDYRMEGRSLWAEVRYKY